MSKHPVTIRINDEVNCVVMGLKKEHREYFWSEYGVHVPGYNFAPKYQMGVWDGKIRFFSKTGQTYLYLLDDIIPRIIRLGYKIKLSDNRKAAAVHPELIDENFFSNIIDEKTGKPWVMRDYQVEMVNALISEGNGIGIAGTGGGKAQPLYSKILTPNGWKTIGEIQINDEVITPCGNISNVLNIFPQGKKEIYEIEFHDGSKTRACVDHLWKVQFPVKLASSKTQERVVTTKDIIDFYDKKERKEQLVKGQISIPLCDSIEQEERELPLDPYLLGVLIGDGTLSSGSIQISSVDKEIIDKISILVEPFESNLKLQDECTYRISKIDNYKKNNKNLLMECIRDLGLYGKHSYSKFIPELFKKGSIDQRLELIRGLMDTDGYVDKRGHLSFCTVSKKLAKDFQEVIWSLGGTCTITQKQPFFTYKDKKKKGRIAYNCYIRHQYPNQFVSLSRKLERCRDEHGDGRIVLTRRIKNINFVGVEDAKCILINDQNHLYITDDYIVTHNTSMTAALALAYEKAAGLKSIIIVPDKNLTVQTVREYAFFGLDVGQYSGDKKDLDHQHIVSTWQSLNNNKTLIQHFGVVVVDECHGAKAKVIKELLVKYGHEIAYRFGVTGTLPKEKSDAMGVHTSLGPKRYEIKAHQLISDGHLANIHIHIFQLKSDLGPEYQQYLDDDPELPLLTYSQFRDQYFRDWTMEKNYLHGLEDRAEWIADKIEERRSGGKGNTLCLVNGIKYGKKLAKMIDGAIFLHGKDQMKVRQEAYGFFKDRDDVVVIATIQIASTGLDIPRIFNLFYIDVGRSFIRTIQTIGRGLRKAHDKDHVNVYDICSDTKHSRRHLGERMKFYKEAKYPNKKHAIEYL